jgi:transcriptional regulator with XRE-family HTH domain
MTLGARIRTTRTQKGITLQEIADRTGLSKGFLCQLENDKSSPSIQALEKIASALGVPMAFLFLTQEQQIHVVRAGERQYHYGPDNLRVQLLSGNRRALTMMLIEFPPGTATGGEGHAHDGEECHFVLEGAVRATQGDQQVILQAGDSFHWNGFVPHRVENVGQTVARVLCVTQAGVEDVLEPCECEENEPVAAAIREQ